MDDEYQGEVTLLKGYTRGMLEQEPKLDDSKTVSEVVQEAVQPLVDLQHEIRRGQRQILRARRRLR